MLRAGDEVVLHGLRKGRQVGAIAHHAPHDQIIIVTAGLKKLLGVPIGLGIALNVLWIALGVPMAMLFMRGPV